MIHYENVYNQFSFISGKSQEHLLFYENFRFWIQLRMKQKLETAIKGLNDLCGLIEDVFNTGVVEGFTKEPLS